MKTLIAAIAAFAMTSLTTATVYAQTPGVTTESTKVFYGDLNLNTDAGMKTLKARIHHAAYSICDVTGAVPIEVRADSTKCMTTAIREAMKQVPSRDPQFASR